MKRDPDDGELRRLFAELRAADARGTPPFDAVWGTASTRALRRRAPRRLSQLAAAAVLLVAAGALLFVARGRPSSPPPVALSSWRSPTEFLLHVPGDHILRTVPTTAESVLRLESVGPLEIRQ